jgi:hypothetical protein
MHNMRVDASMAQNTAARETRRLRGGKATEKKRGEVDKSLNLHRMSHQDSQ